MKLPYFRFLLLVQNGAILMGSFFPWFAKFWGSFDAVSRNLGLNLAVCSLDKSALVYDFMHLVQRNQSEVHNSTFSNAGDQ